MTRSRTRSRPARGTDRPAAASTGGARTGALAAAVTLAALHALWALFQWTELVAARGGGDAFCGLGGGACATLWDSDLAVAVQRATGLPLAAWGLVWSVAAFGPPLAALARRHGTAQASVALAAAQWTALAGVAAVVGLAATSLGLGGLCTTCAVTYALVLSYAGAIFAGTTRMRGPAALRGAALAAALTGVAFLALLPLGRRTPGASPSEARSTSGATAMPADGDLARRLAALPPATRQVLSDALEAWRRAPANSRPARAPLGPATAQVRITEFSDVLCGHCAQLHEALEALRRRLPKGSFSLDSRQFPLDATCNPLVSHRSEDGLRCLAARARVCLEERPEDAFAYAGALFENRRNLDAERVFALAEPYLPRERLEACVAAPETAERLRADIAWAAELGIEGTPLVLVNGRRAAHFPPLLEALVLARADPEHPAFARLPAPKRARGS